jgi:hypothetical protein
MRRTISLREEHKTTGRRPANLHRAAIRSWAPNHDVKAIQPRFSLTTL